MQYQLYVLSYVDHVLIVSKFEIWNLKFLNMFMSKCFAFQIFWAKKNSGQILRNNSTEQFSFHWQTFKFLGGHNLNILIQRYFQRKENIFINLVLKAKQQKAIQLP